MDDGPLWIFGYGSLVWRPAFPHVERRPACVRGWQRRFWQASIDHRGVPEAPGRVVTVLRHDALGAPPDGACWGMAYRVAHADRDAVLADLDHRERGGYERVTVGLEDASGLFARGLMYVATPQNPNYTGPTPIDDIARVARIAVGPSGPNRHYVRELARALHALGASDDHVFALDAAIARLDREEGVAEPPRGVPGDAADGEPPGPRGREVAA